tara:strand:- start:612 stop:836 length:225 start_codon:yes stop_codon:yes gene_type:complete
MLAVFTQKSGKAPKVFDSIVEDNKAKELGQALALHNFKVTFHVVKELETLTVTNKDLQKSQEKKKKTTEEAATE